MILINNFFNKPEEVLDFANDLSYHEPDETSGWDGLRTDAIRIPIIEEVILKHYDVSEIRCHFHLTHKSTEDGDKWQNKIHKDDPEKVAGIVYLNHDAPPNTGTTFYDEDKNVDVVVENKFNRLLIYPSDIYHAPTGLFDNRLTLTIFAR